MFRYSRTRSLLLPAHFTCSSLGLYVPWASARAALVSGLVSLVSILWVALGGNFSRLTGQHVTPALAVSTQHCPTDWDLSQPSASAGSGWEEWADWWPHLAVYEISYMWYSGLACCTTVCLGAALSCLPGFKQVGILFGQRCSRCKNMFPDLGPRSRPVGPGLPRPGLLVAALGHRHPRPTLARHQRGEAGADTALITLSVAASV